MTSSQAKAKAKSIFGSKPNGREKEYFESIYWGVAKPYADKKDCVKAGIKILPARESRGGVYYYLTQSDTAKLIMYLNK